jgi:hypothetical protein
MMDALIVTAAVPAAKPFFRGMTILTRQPGPESAELDIAPGLDYRYPSEIVAFQ